MERRDSITDEQRKLAEDNHNLIYEFLKQRDLSIEEYYDIAAIGLCKAAIHYNGKISKFSTYAFKVMRNEIFINFREKTRAREIPEAKLVYYNNKLENDEGSDGDTAEVINYIPSHEDTAGEAIANILMSSYMNKLNPRNKLILQMIKEGYKQREISRALGISQAQVSRIVNGVKKYLT